MSDQKHRHAADEAPDLDGPPRKDDRDRAGIVGSANPQATATPE